MAKVMVDRGRANVAGLLDHLSEGTTPMPIDCGGYAGADDDNAKAVLAAQRESREKEAGGDEWRK